LLTFSVSAPSTLSGSVIQKCKCFWHKINFELKFANINGCKTIWIYSMTCVPAVHIT